MLKVKTFRLRNCCLFVFFVVFFSKLVDFFLFVAVPEGPVRNLVVTTTARTASVAFDPPAVITGVFRYRVTYNGQTVTQNQSPITIMNLTPNTAYTFTVRILNFIRGYLNLLLNYAAKKLSVN